MVLRLVLALGVVVGAAAGVYRAEKGRRAAAAAVRCRFDPPTWNEYLSQSVLLYARACNVLLITIVCGAGLMLT